MDKNEEGNSSVQQDSKLKDENHSLRTKLKGMNSYSLELEQCILEMGKGIQGLRHGASTKEILRYFAENYSQYALKMTEQSRISESL
jgi:hypothetical protein